MNRIAFWLRISLLAMLTLSLSGCSKHYSWNQRIEIVVNTPSGVISASSIQKMGVTDTPMFAGAGGMMRENDVGEAIVADMGDGRYLFVLIPSENAAPQTFSEIGASTKERFRQVLAMKGEGAAEMPRGWWPLFVTFGSLSDPLSMELVDPENLATTFGEGYSLETITLSIVDDAPSLGRTLSLLPWLSAMRGGHATILGEPEKVLDKKIPDRAKFKIRAFQFTSELDLVAHDPK